MCTVTIFPVGENDFVLTSNRDEAKNRVSLAPKIYTAKGAEMLLPKDEVSGGTWVGVSSKNRVLCLLNGGFVKHKRKEVYRQSRGLVVNDLLVCENIVASIEDYDFDKIEPFTLVIADWNRCLQFFELVWDGSQKHFSRLPLEPKIWSSSTLYSEEQKQKRLKWFEDFRSENALTSATALEFHKTAGKGNVDFGVIMDREFVKTTSVTQVEKTEDVLEMRYDDLTNSKVEIKKLNLSPTVNG